MSIIKTISISIFVLLMLFTAVKFLNPQNLAGVATVIGSQQKIIYAECISTFTDAPLQTFSITNVHLNDDQKQDALVQYESDEACGSAGCVYELCISGKAGTYEHIPFGFAAKEIQIGDTKTNGMKDLILNADKALKMSWDGQSYVLSTN
jgi:hypothetical protein